MTRSRAPVSRPCAQRTTYTAAVVAHAPQAAIASCAPCRSPAAMSPTSSGTISSAGLGPANTVVPATCGREVPAGPGLGGNAQRHAAHVSHPRSNSGRLQAKNALAVPAERGWASACQARAQKTRPGPAPKNGCSGPSPAAYQHVGPSAGHQLGILQRDAAVHLRGPDTPGPAMCPLFPMVRSSLRPTQAGARICVRKGGG